MSRRAVGSAMSILPLALLLVLACLALVSSQHRARAFFVELGRLQAQAKELEAEGDRLRIELGKASQPATVAAAARNLGLRPADGKQTVYLPQAPPADLAAAGSEVRR